MWHCERRCHVALNVLCGHCPFSLSWIVMCCKLFRVRTVKVLLVFIVFLSVWFKVRCNVLLLIVGWTCSLCELWFIQVSKTRATSLWTMWKGSIIVTAPPCVPFQTDDIRVVASVISKFSRISVSSSALDRTFLRVPWCRRGSPTILAQAMGEVVFWSLCVPVAILATVFLLCWCDPCRSCSRKNPVRNG